MTRHIEHCEDKDYPLRDPLTELHNAHETVLKVFGSAKRLHSAVEFENSLNVSGASARIKPHLRAFFDAHSAYLDLRNDRNWDSNLESIKRCSQGPVTTEGLGGAGSATEFAVQYVDFVRTSLTPFFENPDVIDQDPMIASTSLTGLESKFRVPMDFFKPMLAISPPSASIQSHMKMEYYEARNAANRILELHRTEKNLQSDQPKGKPGRRGYPLKALELALKIREDNPRMKATQIRRECLKHFSEDDLPEDGNSFRRWMNRTRANRAN